MCAPVPGFVLDLLNRLMKVVLLGPSDLFILVLVKKDSGRHFVTYLDVPDMKDQPRCVCVCTYVCTH